MAFRLAYLMLTRMLSRLALLAPADAAKDVEILVLRHRSRAAPPPRHSEGLLSDFVA